MALPEDIVTVTTATWSDHKNQPHGPVQRITSLPPGGAGVTDDGTFYNLGNNLEYVGQKFLHTGTNRLMRARFFFQRVGAPSGTIQLQLRPFTSGAPDFNTLLAASQTYPVSAIPTSGKNETVFTFQVPYNLAASVDYVVVMQISTPGDASNYIKVYRGDPGIFSAIRSGSQPFGSSTWTQDSSLRTSFDLELATNEFFAFGLDKTNNKARLYRTLDTGATWTELDAANAPAVAATATLRSMYVQRKVDDWIRTWVLLPISTTSFRWHWLQNTWAINTPAPSSVTVATIGANVSGQAPYGGGVSAGGVVGGTVKATIAYQGATETNMGLPWRRIKFERYDGASWLTSVDAVGSTNTPNATLPAINIHFDLRWAGMDPLGNTHIIYSKSDSSILQYRKFKADGTFTTINTMNGAVASATANYPVGQPAFYYQAPDWFIAVPYVDNSSNTLKVARCNVSSSETSANWTITEAVAANAETSASNPAVLTTEDLQGNKLLLWRVTPTTKTLNFTHDAGSNTWATEVPWRSGQAVEGISAQPMEDGGGLMYLDTAPATDELRYDRL